MANMNDKTLNQQDTKKVVTIQTECQEGVCPICHGDLDYGLANQLEQFRHWTCACCGATGKEGFDAAEVNEDDDGSGEWWEYVQFDGSHFDVSLKDGTRVNIQQPKRDEDTPAEVTPEPITIVVVCKEDICPVCGGTTNQTGNTYDTKYGVEHEWLCSDCGAKGYAQYEEETNLIFTRQHKDVITADGVPVNIVTPPLPKNSKTWKIPVAWELCGYVYVDAPTLAEAMKKVRTDNDDIPLPEGSYVDGSFVLSYDDETEIRSLHNQNQKDCEVSV